MANESISLKGAWDVHVHASPCVSPRKMTAVELATKAQESGMSGFVLKSHHGSTSELATVINDLFLSLTVYGGVTLNRTVGGLNPLAVEASFLVGGRLVWLPTKDGVGHPKISKLPSPEALSILDEQDRVNTATREVIALVAQYNGILGTGHIGCEEILILHKYIRKNAPKLRLLINHSQFLTPDLKLTDISSLINPNTYFECCYLTVSRLFSFKSAEQVASIIKRVPDAQWIIASDSGQPHNLDPVDALSDFHRQLLEQGLSQNQLSQASVITPERLLRS